MIIYSHTVIYFNGVFYMYKVCVSFLDTIDEWGYKCEYHDFKSEGDALAFYSFMKSDYKDTDLVSVDLCF